MSRRAADAALVAGRILADGVLPMVGHQVTDTTRITLDGKPLDNTLETVTILLNKPVGYVCSRDGQGNRTVYDLLPESLHHLKPVGRLDKDSSGLLLLSNDGQFAYELTHPKFEKVKKYKIAINKDLSEEDFKAITNKGVMLDDGVSKFSLDSINNQNKEWKVEMKEGRNRQIRRTFEALGYNVVKLHRTHFGTFTLSVLKPGSYTEV